MGKSTFFTGQPILNQLLNLIDRGSVKTLARAGQHDRYYRYFDTYTHLVTMLYCVLNKCTSSREVVSGMKACCNKLKHAGISKAPGRSTLCDANMKRSYTIFEQLYEQLYRRHKQLLPDSRLKTDAKLFIADSSTITLFQQKRIKLKSRQVTFFDREKGRTFEFLTNNFSLTTVQIADLYKKRWQIEILFKRIKQNFPLKYFLGDNENAIKIQIWCAFIADLMIKLVQVQLKRKWAFSNLSSIIRLHLMSYINLFDFLNNPEKLSVKAPPGNQLKIRGLELGFIT